MNASERHDVLWQVMSFLCSQTKNYLLQKNGESASKPDIEAVLQILSDPLAKAVAKELGSNVRELVGEHSAQSVDWVGLSLPNTAIDAACDFDDAYSRGWLIKHRALREADYTAKVNAFIAYNKALALNVGDVIFVQSKSLQQEWLSGPVVYVHPECHVIVMELPPKAEGHRPEVFVIGEFTTLFEIHREIPRDGTP